MKIEIFIFIFLVALKRKKKNGKFCCGIFLIKNINKGKLFGISMGWGTLKFFLRMFTVISKY